MTGTASVPNREGGTRLVAFDLDGTLTRGNTCMQAVAAGCGFAEKVLEWERARTERDLVEMRTSMWQELSCFSMEEFSSALSTIPLAPGAKDGVAELHAAGIEVVIVSLTLSWWAQHFAGQLGVDTVIATEPDGDGGFRHVFPSSKPILLADYAHGLGIGLDQIAAVGDSTGDVPMLDACGLSVFVGAGLPDGHTPNHHLPGASIDEVANTICR